jgi:hypothetical protein
MKRKPKLPNFQELMSFLNDFSDLADIVSRINGKPKTKDWLAIAMKSGTVGQRVYDRARNLWVIQEQKKIIGWKSKTAWNRPLQNMRSVGRLVRKESEAEKESVLAVRLVLDRKHPIILNKMTEPGELYYRPEDEDTIRQVIQDFIWESGFVVTTLRPQDTYKVDPGIERECERELASRIQKYRDAGETRVFMLKGLPGTGKTESCARVCSNMKLRTFTAPAGALQTYAFSTAVNCGAEAVIVDDLDWANKDDMADTLDRLSSLRRICPLVLVTANTVKGLPDPMLRPGRIDEIIEWPGCTPAELEALGAPAECEGWPIASVQEAVKRIRIEGRVDLKEIETRIGEDEPVSRRGARKSGRPGGYVSGGPQNGLIEDDDPAVQKIGQLLSNTRPEDGQKDPHFTQPIANGSYKP